LTLIPRQALRRAFRRFEGFSYKMVQGALVVQKLFQVEEQDPSKLQGPMNVPLAPPK
jgi:hypothetical protein